MISLNKDISYKKTEWEPLTDVTIPRCPEISSFHFSLDRVFGKNYEFSGETHPFYELVYVLSGAIGITAGDRVYTLNAGQFLIHPPNEFHRIRSERGTEPHVLNLSFHADCMPESDSRIFAPDMALQGEFLEISRGVKNGLHNSDLTLLCEERARLESWLLRALKNTGVDCVSKNSGAIRYAEIVAMLRENLSEQLSAEDIARLCHMSLSNLKKIFGRYAGMGVSRYFTEMKMRRAVELLRSGERVGEVANQLGYSDQNYFSTVFRRIMGVPPGYYRK
jgi:AraC-like DNA-binding protein/quercetin dioxygenase-like cupin family protein